MADKQVNLKLIEGKNYVDVDKSIEAIKKELETNESILIVARGIEISRVAVVIRRAEEECNCTIAKMQTHNVKVQDKDGNPRRVLEFHAKLLKKK